MKLSEVYIFKGPKKWVLLAIVALIMALTLIISRNNNSGFQKLAEINPGIEKMKPLDETGSPPVVTIEPNADAYKWNPEWTKVYHKHTITGREFEAEYAIFSNQHHLGGYVIIREFSVFITTDEDENVADGQLFTIMQANTPAEYIEAIKVNDEATSLAFEVRPLGNYTHRIETMLQWNLEDLPISDTLRWFRTIEAMIIAQEENAAFTEADVKAAGERMEGREHGIQIQTKSTNIYNSGNTN